MGLALLANLAACDFGYLSVGQLVRRTQDALGAMQRLERHRGHFFNWYDTRTLKPLLPLYVSSVDSGNLAGHLLTLGPGLAEFQAQPILTPQVFAGLSDTVGILRELTGRSAELEQLEAELAQPPSTLRAGFDLLQRATDRAAALAAALEEGAGEELKWWTQALERNCRDHLEDLLFLAPWLALAPDSAPQGPLPPRRQSPAKLAQLDQAPTLRQVSELDQSLCPLLEAALQALSLEPASSRKPEEEACLVQWLRLLREAGSRAGQRILALETLARQSAELAEMDFSFLFDPARELFSIGFNVTESRLDASFYDLLASEARLCSYVVIAQGQVSQDNWFCWAACSSLCTVTWCWLPGAGRCLST